MFYKAFISYSHAADGKLAPSVQSALHRFAKPWYRLRAARVFRDKTSLTLNPALWPTIENALGESEYFLLLASVESAASPWVKKEIDYWLRHSAADKILIILTGGELFWDETAGDFDWDATTALPESLRGTFRDQPLYLDLRWAKTEEHISVRNPKFRNAIAELSAALRGIPKDQLVGEDVRQHKKAMRLAWSAVLGLLALTLIAVLLAYTANKQRNIAEQRSKIALSRQLAAQALNQANTRPDLALLLSLEANRIHETLETKGNLLDVLEAKPQLITYMRKHKEIIYAVDFTNNGKTIVSAGGDNKIIFWDVSSHKIIGDPITVPHLLSLAVSPDGSTVAAGTSVGSITLWDTDSRRQIGQTFSWHETFVNSLAFSPDGKRLASANMDGSVVLWEVATQKPVSQPIINHSSPMQCIAFSSDGQKLASGNSDGQIILWDLEENRPACKILSIDRGAVNDLTFTANSHKLVSASGNTITIWDLDTCQPSKYDIIAPDAVYDLAVYPHKALLAAAQSRGSITLWDLISGEQIGPPLIGHLTPAPITSVAFSPDGRTMVSGGWDKAVILWDLEKQLRTGKSIIDNVNAAYSSDISPDGGILAIGSDNQIYLHDAKSLLSIDTLKGHSGRVVSLDFSPDGKLLASGSYDKSVRIWNLDKGKPVDSKVIVLTDRVEKVAFHPDGHMLASASLNGPIIFWNVTDQRPIGEPIRGQAGGVQAFAFDPDGRTLAFADQSGIFILDIAKHIITARGKAHSGSINSMIFSPDGKTLATCGLAGRIVLWDVNPLEPRGSPLIRHMDSVTSAAFGPEGRILVSAGSNGAIIFWDVENHLPISQPLKSHHDYATSLTFDEKGETLISTGFVPGVILWDMRFESWQALACQIANRNMTHQEWKQFLGDIPEHQTCPGIDESIK